jgi:hypothetical protein
MGARLLGKSNRTINMGYGQSWPERKPRPKARSLADEDKTKMLAMMTKEIASSPVLSGLGVQVRLQRGRFYLEKPCDEDDAAEIEELGRITPLAGLDAGLLLEVEHRKGSWSEVARGSAQKVIRTVASDSEGTFHGMGSLDKALRKSGKGLERVPVKLQGKRKFVYAGTGVECSVQEALFHYFGLPLTVIAEPSEWYSYHREPKIVEVNQDRTQVLVRFTADSFDGTEFGGTCLYACRDGKWDAYTIKPSESRDIVTAEAWLVKRKWRAWG